ncbi:uncharacterized protein A4U43_C05F9350 [Asparagus officinalis]|uniref:Uncharacterized protein n=1 Tax=Asparagus officinalis TaxID=4686 RepID=A0A5P1EQQ0_ASPOF|nr:uncharacterized protein A4U43_C05F9350 [Asparagus officinalis]
MMEVNHPSTAEEEALKKNTDCIYFLASPFTCKKDEHVPEALLTFLDLKHLALIFINKSHTFSWAALFLLASPFLEKFQVQVMEQCVSRLDVAMFNAILRESENDMPTDPVSNPIVDSKVLPIPAGDLSFGSGAQLKISLVSPGAWLTDLTQKRYEVREKRAQKSATSCFQSTD